MSETAKPSVLFVSIAFPPKTSAEGLQVAKYVKYLTRACQDRFSIDVLTSSLPTLNMPYDESLEPFADGCRQILQLPILESRYINYLLRKLWPTQLCLPDTKAMFHRLAWVVPFLLRSKPSLIYSRAFPLSSSVMGLKLKRRWGVPWVMHLSDPWVDDPCTVWFGNGRAINEKLERACIQAADVITVTSHKTIAFYEKKYAGLGKRFEYFPNVYDPADIPTKREPDFSKSKLRLVHTGAMFGTRTPEQLLRAVSGLPASAKDRLEIIFAGDMDRANVKIVESFNCEFLTCLGQVDYSRSLELQRSADALLMIEFPVPDPNLRVYFPSKLLDYFLTGKPIVTLCEDQSEIYSALNGVYGPCFARHDIEGLRQHIAELIERKDRKDAQYFAPRSLSQTYDAALQAGRLADLFETLVQGIGVADNFI